jgi:hypothetical protein
MQLGVLASDYLVRVESLGTANFWLKLRGISNTNGRGTLLVIPVSNNRLCIVFE